MKLFRKKIKPEDMITKMKVIETRLHQRENKIQNHKEKARQNAKIALKTGDGREFRVSSKRYGLLDSQLKTVSSMIEVTMSMSDLIEVQRNIGEIVEIGNMLTDNQKYLGMNPEKVEKALSNITASIESMNNASELMTASIEGMISSDSEVTDAQESLRAEIMTEVASETEAEEGLKEKIDKAKSK